ncbi:MAG: FecR domain-containing protein, partial [Prolixibacteraceae bacterium]|nr:FecR domain-containing protein [Prolixibacteraceae bacterium]
MDIYEQLIENPLFFKWIFHPTEELNDYWATYLEQNPEETDAVLEFKSKFEKNLKFTNTTFSEERKKRLARQIAKQLDKLDQKKKRRIFLHNIMKYAAVALLFFTIGSSLVYLYMANRQPEMLVENSVLPAHAQEPVLIIDNKQQIQLNSGESELDYSNSGEIIVNNAESVKKKAKGLTPEMNTLIIPYGSRSVITLADGSKVWLNAGSRLIYPSEFVDKRREVFLVGEAFFDITKDESQPFYV